MSRCIHDDLNLPRAMAVTWDLVRSDVPAATKQATLWQFDRVLGLQLTSWPPSAAVVPEALMALILQRQQARAEKRWQDADALREQVKAGWLHHRRHAARAAPSLAAVETGN